MILKCMNKKFDMDKPMDKRLDFEAFKLRERHLSVRYRLIMSHLTSLKSVIEQHKIDLKNNKLVTPPKITRTVGLQADYHEIKV